MVERLTVIFFIILCVLLGFYLTILPWFSFGLISDWGDNFVLAFVVEKTGMPILHQAVASNVVSGSGDGLGRSQSPDRLLGSTHFGQSVHPAGVDGPKMKSEPHLSSGSDLLITTGNASPENFTVGRSDILATMIKAPWNQILRSYRSAKNVFRRNWSTNLFVRQRRSLLGS